MATAREESAYGAGGKFKKRPFRRSTQTTPYDRPSTALRNPTNISINSNNGWFSKLFDPAQRLIVSSAHRFFGSVFRKRLTPPPPPPPPAAAAAETEANQEETNMHQEQVYTDHASIQGAIRSHDDLNNSSDRGGVTELEQILKQKTFSRSDIDRLTALLQSRTAETVRDEQKIPEVISSKESKPVVLHNRKEAPLDTSFKENGIANAANQLISTPVVSSSVLDEDIASPAELAKAYMSSRPLKVSPSMPGMRGQAFREKSTVLSDQPLPSASPALSLVPRSSGHFGISENGFVSPRSRGRSATYSLARAPYSRVHSTTALKVAGLTIDSVAGPSSSPQSTWEKNRRTGSKQGSLKRRSLVLDSDIGSVGPIRRIRQKHNLLSSKSLSLAASRSPLSVRGSGVADTVQYPTYSLQKPLLPTHGFTKLLTENRDNSLPSTSSTPIPSKSSEMASKILQQLDKLVSSREKSPTKLSPSTLHGPALKSLENADFSISMENVQDNNRSNGSLDSVLPDFRDFSSQKRDKVEENGPTKIFSPKLIPATNGVDAAGIIKDNVPSTKMTNFALTNSTAHPHQQRDLSLQMSAHEDFLELVDNDYCNGPPSMPLADGIDKLSASLDYKTTAADAITVEKSPACSDIQEKNYGAIDAGRGPVFASSTVPSSSMTAQSAEIATLSTLTSNKAANESSGSPIFSFGEKFASPKESNDVPSSFSTGTTNVDKVPQFPSTYSSSVISKLPTFKFGVPLNSMPESSTSLASDAVGATDSVTKVPESYEADNRVGFRTPETSLPSAASTLSSTASIFSFGAPANCSTLNDGSLVSCPSSNSSPTPPLFSSIGFNQNLFSSSTVSFATSSSIATSSATELSTAAPIFKFGSSPVPLTSTSTSTILATSGIESTVAKKNETGFGSGLFGASSAFAGSSIFGGTSSTVANTGSSIFGFSAGAATAAAFSQGQASNSFAAGAAQASVNGISVATTTQSMPTQFGSTALSKSFISSTNASLSSIISFTSAATATSSQPAYGSASSAFTFASASSNNNDQMNMEDSMAEDTVPTSTPTVAAFGQQPITPPSTFVFGSTVGANPFQFGSQQNLDTPQNPSPFNAGGGSFSLGTGGGDKSQRRIVKVRKLRKK